MLSFAQIASLATRIILSVFLINETPRVKSELVNVAIGKSTSQSGEKWPSRNAVDGQMECMNVDEQHFTLTDYSQLPWWEVNLGDQFRIQKIIVHGRHDSTTNQLHGFRLYLSSSNQFTENNIVYTNTDYNGGTISIALNLTGLFQFVKLDLPDTYRFPLNDDSNDKLAGPLVLCEVEVFVNMTNVALGKPASMSSVYSGMAAGKSVDGNPRRDADQCSCCSHSMNEPNPWLKIDLLQSYKIFFITVIGRSDSNQGNRLLGGLNIEVDSSQTLGSYIFSNDSVVTVKFPVGITARNVTITRPKKQVDGEWFLVVCEVKIYTTDCQAGTYKDNKGGQCKSCGHCKNKPCNKDIGTCPGSVCIAGWSGDKCYTACEDGQYGENCLQNCSGHCLNGNSQCSKIDGKCQEGCILGYQGENCASPCPHSMYGLNCTKRCNTCKQMKCRNTDGLCAIGCVPGYKPENRYCNKGCDDGQFGQNCSKSCSGHCKNGNQQCNKASGICMQRCVDGYIGDTCETECPVSTYGKNCSQICTSCNDLSCNSTDGLCFDGCVPGYTSDDPYCSTICEVGKYGTGCSQSCHCLDKKVCDSVTGKCQNPGCLPGWSGDSCNLICNTGRFGFGCSKQCNCINNTACSNTDGKCLIPECKLGWTGDACDKDNNILDRLRYEVKTSMSTTAGNWTSDRAVDGNTGPDPNKCQCCSGTTNAPLSWWMVDLGERFPLNGIAIYSRNNENDNRQLQRFQVIVSPEATYDASSFMSESLGMFSKMYVIKLKDTLTRYIKIQRPGILTLCEVKVFQGVCKLGRFGKECAHECHCADNKPCNQLAGYCQSSACKTGWQGPSCNETCPPETFGDNCSDRCYCAEGTCTSNYGICPGNCRQGYHGAHCNQVGSEVKRDTTVLLGVIGATGACLVVAVIIGIVVLKFRRKSRDSIKSEYETPNHRDSPTEIQEYDTIENVNDSAVSVSHDYVNETVTGL